MSASSEQSLAVVECGVATRALDSAVVSGDLHIVAGCPQGMLLGVADGLGHGPEAATAARAAAGSIHRHAGESIADIVRQCHAELRKTRGVVLSLASIDTRGGTMTWLGVGNVEGILFRADPGARRETLLLRSGVVGYQMPPLRPAMLPIFAGDTLVFATDGIAGRFSECPPKDDDPQDVADQLLANYRKDSDDALVFVARYVGGRP